MVETSLIDREILNRITYSNLSWNSTLEKFRTIINRDMSHNSEFVSRVKKILRGTLERETAHFNDVSDFLKFAAIVADLRFSFERKQFFLTGNNFYMEISYSDLSVVNNVRFILGTDCKVSDLLHIINSFDISQFVHHLEGLKHLFDIKISPNQLPLLYQSLESIEQDIHTISMFDSDFNHRKILGPVEIRTIGIPTCLTIFNQSDKILKATIEIKVGESCQLQTTPICSYNNSNLEIGQLTADNSQNVTFSFALRFDVPVVFHDKNVKELESLSGIVSLEWEESQNFLQFVGFQQKNKIKFDYFGAEIGYKVNEIWFTNVKTLIDIIEITRRQLLLNTIIQNCMDDVNKNVNVKTITREKISLLLVFNESFIIVNFVLNFFDPCCHVENDEELSSRLTLIFRRYLSIPLVIKALEIAELGQEFSDPIEENKNVTDIVEPLPFEENKEKAQQQPIYLKYISNKKNSEFGIPTYEELFPHCQLISQIKNMRIPGGFSAEDSLENVNHNLAGKFQNIIKPTNGEIPKSEDTLKKPRGRPRKKTMEGEILAKRVRKIPDKREIIFENRFTTEMIRNANQQPKPFNFGPFENNQNPNNYHQNDFVPSQSVRQEYLKTPQVKKEGNRFDYQTSTQHDYSSYPPQKTDDLASRSNQGLNRQINKFSGVREKLNNSNEREKISRIEQFQMSSTNEVTMKEVGDNLSLEYHAMMSLTSDKVDKRSQGDYWPDLRMEGKGSEGTGSNSVDSLQNRGMYSSTVKNNSVEGDSKSSLENSLMGGNPMGENSVDKLYNQAFFTCTDFMPNFRIPKKQNKKN